MDDTASLHRSPPAIKRPGKCYGQPEKTAKI
jgi:hypothetical protein